MRKNILQSGKCFICKSNYVDIVIGNHHIYGSCHKCGTRDEIGLVFIK